MRFSTLFLVLCLGLAGTSTTEIPAAPMDSGLAVPDGTSDAFQEARSEVRSAFEDIRALLSQEEIRLREATRETRSSRLEDLLRRCEESAQGCGGQDAEILSLLREARDAASLTDLVLVTHDGSVLSPRLEESGFDEESTARRQATFVVLSEPFFRDGEPAFSVESFPAAMAREGSAALPDDVFPELSLLAVEPVWLRPDYPHSVLIGVTRIQDLSPAVEARLGRSVLKLRWHAFLREETQIATIVAGAGRGLPLDEALTSDLSVRGTSEVAAFPADSETFGRWRSFDSYEGRVEAGWGITAEPGFLRTVMGGMTQASDTSAPAPAGIQEAPLVMAETPRTVARGGSRPVSRSGESPAPWSVSAEDLSSSVLWVVAAVIAGGVLWLLVGAWLSSRKRRAILGRMSLPSGTPEDDEANPRAPVRTGDELLAQFEINWKTFASYTQDLLQQKVKDLEEAPQRGLNELRDRVEQLSDSFVGLRDDLSGTQEEIKQNAIQLTEHVESILEHAKEAVPGLSSTTEELLGRIEGDFKSTREQFSELEARVNALAGTFGERQAEIVEEKVAEERSRSKSELEQRAQDFEEERRADREEREALLEELAESHKADDTLQGLLAEANQRQEAIESRLEEEKATRAQAEEECDGANRRAAEIDEALRQERARVTELEDRVSAREGELEEAKSLADKLQDELDESREREEKYREAIKEVYREEGRFQKDLERKEKQFEEERGQLDQKLAELEESLGKATAEKETLENRLEGKEDELSQLKAEQQRRIDVFDEGRRGSEAERERLNEICETRARELDALTRAFDALKEENRHLGDEARQSAEELDTLRNERSEEEQLSATAADLESKLTDLTDTLRERDIELETTRHAREDLEEAVRQRGEELEQLRSRLESAQGELEELKGHAEASREADTDRGALLEELEGSRRSGEALRVELEKVQDTFNAEKKNLQSTEKKLRTAEKERLQYKTRYTELEAKWQAKLGEFELKLADVDRERDHADQKLGAAEKSLDALKKQLAEAETAVNKLSTELETERGEARDKDDATKKLRALQEEKVDLNRNLERLDGELRRVREEAEEIRRFQGTLVEGSFPAAILGIDKSLKVFAWNHRATAIWGKKASDAEGKSLESLSLRGFDKEGLDQVRKVVRSASSSELPQSSFPDGKGGTRHLRWTCDPIIGPDGKALGAVLLAEDVSQQLEQEIEARLQSLFNASLVRSLPAALVVADARDRVISWNRHAEDILGVAEEEALGAELFHLRTPLAREVFRRRYDENRKRKQPTRLRVRLEANGVPGQYMVTQCPFLGEADAVRGTILMIQEVAVGVETA